MPDQPPDQPNLLHRSKKHVSVVAGDLLFAELAHSDPRRADILEIDKAGRAALALAPKLANRLR